MSSQNYAPRHGAARHARKRSGLVTAVRRPVIGGAIAVAMLGSVGATVAIGDPSHSSDQTTAAMSAPASESSATTSESTQADMARLAESRRVTNISRSASREQDRLSAIERKDKAAAAKKAAAKRKAAAKKKAADKKKAAEKAKPMSQREFTDDQLKQIQADPAPYGKELAAEYGWGEGEWSCLVSLWIGESNWQWDATNSSSGAYGIPQSLPATKMATAGPDWKTNPVTQMKWGMDYIKASYGTPCGAKSFWDSKSPHWY